MPGREKSISWESTKAELNVCRQPNGNVDFDYYRKSKLTAVEKKTGVPLVVYATDYLNAQKVRAAQGQVDIDLTDLQGFNEVTKDLPEGPLDVLLHSPGGSPEATESIVQVIRSKFKPIRFFVPVAAKSAATLLALSGNEILMPSSAELGPIDPQFRLSDGAGGTILAPAQALIDQFRLAQSEISQNQTLGLSWAPVLQRYGIGLFQMALNAIDLTKTLARKWLLEYMFDNDPACVPTVEGIVGYLSDHNAFKSHGRRVSLSDLQSRGVKARDIRGIDPGLWQLTEEAWYGVQHTFEGTGAFKLFENSRQRTFVRGVQAVVQIAQPLLPAPPPSSEALR